VTKLRFAQIGLSLIHAPRYRDSLVFLGDDIDIVGFYDPDPDSEAVRSQLKADVAHVPVYATIEELLAEARPDAVMISGYCRDMPAWMELAAKAGVHVWADKPFAVHSSQLLPAKEAIEANGLVFSCGYSWRFEPISREIKRVYDAGLLGKPFSVDARFLAGMVTVREPLQWTLDPALFGGGILNSLGCHWFDLMRFWTGAEVVQVSAIEANVSGEPMAVEDGASVALRFDNGMLGNLYTGNFLPSGSDGTLGLNGSTGSVKWNIREDFCTIMSSHRDWEAAPTRTFTMPKAQLPGYGAAGAGLLRAFIAAIRGEGSSGFTIDDPINSLRIIEAAHESSRTGRTVRLEERGG
jgi:predicted dehydrogenase